MAAAVASGGDLSPPLRPASYDRTDAALLVLLLILGLAARTWIAIFFPGFDHPDENYQATEQAHRLLFGYGVVPWEFRIGARSWLLPGLVAGLLDPLAHIWQKPDEYLRALAVALGVLSLSSVWAAYEIGRRFGRAHALAAGLAVAVWVELAYYGVRPLSEGLATNFLLVAIALVGVEGVSRRRIFLGGAALGAAFVFRFHLAPALAIVAIAAARLEWRGRWLPMAIGAAIPLAILAVVDTLTWGYPFASIVTNFEVNVFAGRADLYGTMQLNWYLPMMIIRWGFAILLIAPLIIVGAAKKPILLVAAAVLILTHSLITHKEYRFIVPAIACLIVLAGLGLAECVAALDRRLKSPVFKRFALPGALVLFALASLAVAGSTEGQARLTAGRNWRDAFAALSMDPSLCGIGLVSNDWTTMPGYAALHRPVPIYFWDSLKHAGLQGAADVLVEERTGAGVSPDPAFSEATCFQSTGGAWSGVCVYRRPGTCTAAPGLELNAELIRRGD